MGTLGYILYDLTRGAEIFGHRQIRFVTDLDSIEVHGGRLPIYRPMTTGLTATADILTGQWRVIDYLLMLAFKTT